MDELVFEALNLHCLWMHFISSHTFIYVQMKKGSKDELSFRISNPGFVLMFPEAKGKCIKPFQHLM